MDVSQKDLVKIEEIVSLFRSSLGSQAGAGDVRGP